MATTGNSLSSVDMVRGAVRNYGLQKQLAADLGLDESALTKFLDGQLPKLARLLDLLELEIVDAGHVNDLRKVLKQVL